MHEFCPTEDWYELIPHAVQDEDPAVEAYHPGEHWVHVVAPALEKEPEGQMPFTAERPVVPQKAPVGRTL